MNCLDEGLLQALIDGELSAETSREAEAHLAACPACAAARAEAAREFAFFSQAFAVGEPLNVPTERLRASVASAVAEIQPAPVFEGVAGRASSAAPRRSFWSSLAASFSPRQVAVFAGLALAALVLAATFFALRPGKQTGDDGPREIAKGTGAPTPSTGGIVTPAASPTAEQPGSQDASGGTTTDAAIAKGMGPKTIRPETGKNQPKGGTPQMVKTPPRPLRPVDRSTLEVASSAKDVLPGERQYVREIAALKTSIERKQFQTLSPTLRAEYERNVAVVDEAIASTRAAARSNPQDRDAQEFLRAAYQEKLDLLSAVAGKSQLASADR